MDKIKIVGIAAGIAAAVALVAGCGSKGHPAATVTHTVTATPAPPSRSSSAARAITGVAAAANERMFADGIAPSIVSIPPRTVTGKVMRAYIRFQHALSAAFAATGNPDDAKDVRPIHGGFQICDASGNSGCGTFTQFTTDSAGRITGVSVEGQPVAGRIATAPPASSGGLTISGVVAYRASDSANTVYVAFKLSDTSYKPVNTSPALLASLNGASDDMNYDALPDTLSPGETLYAAAAFDVGQVTGQFALRPNDGFGEHLPTTTLKLA